jgi:predicted Rdx family selenoprotein
VAAAFTEEQPRLLALPDNSYETEEVVGAKVGKTPHVRFDGNDYSAPHTLVRQVVEVRATLERVRILSAGKVEAEHARSFDRGLVIEDPVHTAELKKSKGEARKHRALDRLAQSAPSAQPIFTLLAQAGANLGRATQQFLALLDAFGGVELELAMREALADGRVLASDVRKLLEARRKAAGGLPQALVDLPDDARVRDLVVRPRDLGSYDQLLRSDEEVQDADAN